MEYFDEFKIWDDELSSLEFIEQEEFNKEYDEQQEWQRTKAVSHGYNYTKFKDYIIPKINFTPNEDHWIFLYESFCSYIACIGNDINEWGAEMFDDNWIG